MNMPLLSDASGTASMGSTRNEVGTPPSKGRPSDVEYSTVSEQKDSPGPLSHADMELKALENRGMLQTASRNNRKVRKRGLLIAELLRNFVNLTVDDVLDLCDVLVAHDVLAGLVVDGFLSLVQTVLNGLLDLVEVLLNGVLDVVEAHVGLLSARTRTLI